MTWHAGKTKLSVTAPTWADAALASHAAAIYWSAASGLGRLRVRRPRQHTGARILILANLSEHKEQVAANTIRNHGLSYRFQDLVKGETIELGADLLLEPYQFVWLAAT